MITKWPKLDYSKWKPTYETLHRWLQIVGKLRLCQSPWTNHSWNTTFYVTSRGFTTSAIPAGEFCLTVDFDFFGHELIIQDSLGRRQTMSLFNKSVAEFYGEFLQMLQLFEIKPTFIPSPNEVLDATPFYLDERHKTYTAEDVSDFFQALVRINNVLLEFRSEFVGKSSPVHFFWGSFDLALTRFSGRRAPEHPGGIPHLSNEVVREAYSHEVMSVGFWPGNETYPQAAFYAYAYPDPENFSNAKVEPQEAFYHNDLHEFILPYETIRSAADPAKSLMSFLESTYQAASNLSKWDRDILEVSPHLTKLKEMSAQLRH